MSTPAPFSPYLEALSRGDGTLPGAALPWLGRLRRAAQEIFAAQGLPTLRTEAWRYTPLRDWPAQGYDGSGAPPRIGLDQMPALLPAEAVAARLVFVNGRFRPDLSRREGLPEGVGLWSLGEALTQIPALLEAHLGQRAGCAGHPFLALNTAALSDGAVLHLAANREVALPVELLFLTVTEAGSESAPPLWQPRILVVAEHHSAVTLVETHQGWGEGNGFSNVAVEAVVEAGACLRHVKSQNEAANTLHIAHTAVTVRRDATYDHFALTRGARLSRHEVRVDLVEPGATAAVNGAYLLRGRQVGDTTSLITHQASHGTSTQLCKGVIDDAARGVFQGRIVVQPGAQKTNGQQINRALLLSATAEVDSKPELEIHADDVKCSHGATVGELADEALFYLRARGIDLETARSLLIAAFIGEAVDTVADDTIRAALSRMVENGLGRCG